MYFVNLEQKIYFEYKECVFEYLAVIMVWEAVMLEIIEREGIAIWMDKSSMMLFLFTGICFHS